MRIFSFFTMYLLTFLVIGVCIIQFWTRIHTRNNQEIKADLIELVIASDPTLSGEEIKNKVNDLYKFIVEDEK